MSKRSIFIPLLMVILGLASGCTPVVDPLNATEVSEQVRVEYDDFKQITYFWGPTFDHESLEVADAPEVEELSIHGQRQHDGTEVFTVRVVDFYTGDWRAYDQAYDSKRNKFHALRVGHYVACPMHCGYEEGLDIQLPMDYLKSHRTSGIRLKLYGAYGESAPFEIPGTYIDGFLRGSFEK